MVILPFFTKAQFAPSQPPLLKKGDKIAIVAPASALHKPQLLKKATNTLKKWGFVPVNGQHLFKKHHHFAGTDTQRISDLQKAINDPSIKAIWCARGGYGSIRIVDKVDFTPLKKQAKWLIGYSDIGVFHQKINQMGIKTLHALMPIDFKRDSFQIQQSLHELRQALTQGVDHYTLAPHKENIQGTATGTLLGGNLSVLTSLIGSKGSTPQKDFILFIEEVGEYKYAIDRMFHSLKRAGYFKHCKGVIVGNFSHKKNDPNFGMTAEQLIKSLLKSYKIPIAFGFKAGHTALNFPLILGGTIQLEVTKTGARIDFSSL